MYALFMFFLFLLFMHHQAFAAHIKLLMCVMEHNNSLFCCVAECNTDNHIISCLKD